MGYEKKCTLSYRGETSEGRALLETDELIFRGDVRVVFPFAEIRSVRASDGDLHLSTTLGTAVLDLGEDAARWADRIRNPKSVLEKLGVRTGMRVSVLGVRDAGFIASLRAAGADVSVGRGRKESDIIFLGVDRRGALSRLATAHGWISPAGAIWVIRPRGTPQITDRDVMAAGKAAGLVDVKVVRFSETHTAEKLVIPRSRR
jgi:hypothetical protein